MIDEERDHFAENIVDYRGPHGNAFSCARWPYSLKLILNYVIRVGEGLKLDIKEVKRLLAISPEDRPKPQMTKIKEQQDNPYQPNTHFDRI